MTSSSESQVINGRYGRYCYATFEFIGQTSINTRCNARFHWKDVGSEVGTELEQVAYFISNLPDTDLLEGGQDLHYGILQEWVYCKDKCIEIARCFLVEKGANSDLLLNLLKADEIDQFTYEFRWIETDLYKNLWMMITTHKTVIVESMKKNWKYPFSSEIELFCQIIREDLEGEFICYLEPFYQYHAKTLGEIDKLKRKQHRDEITPDEEAKMWELIDKSRSPAIWFNRLITIADKLGDLELESIKPYLDRHSDYIDKMSLMHIKADRSPKLKSHKRQSHYVEKGIFKGGVKPRWKP
ncbi:hypothetical protein [Pseudanabaena sp. BC1403]|uniref:hypothetical protein n=1 Tax=Pseudanabaena sp. BC1403 TaxID=2043171 RepID=UPI000CD8724D|nr:hypothetical protein [Pseudanabaena sp. BC1403]